MVPIFWLLVKISFLIAVPVHCFSGWYDIEEVRNTLYEPDISSVLSGIDPSFNLSTVSLDNKESILKKIIEDLPARDDKQYVFIKSKTGQNFACKLPLIEPPKKSQETSYNPKYLAELVSASFYIKNCISKDLGWWKYKLCRGIDVKQWHGAKNEAAQITNSLGIFLGKYAVPSFQTSTSDRLMYLEEQYEGGTLCDLPDKRSARKTAVRYVCDPQLSTSEAYIDQVEEAASCEYLITVKVGSLCSLSAFMPLNLEHPHEIICQPLVSKEAIEKFLEDTIRKRAAQKEAVELAHEALNNVRRIQRRRASMRRTELARDSSIEKSALRSYLDKEYNDAVEKYISLSVMARMGDTLNSDALESVNKLSREVDDIERVFYSYDYSNIHDQDTGNLWYYFHDPTWNKTHFPKSLDWVDTMNAYHRAASKLLNEQTQYSLVQKLFPLLNKNPWIQHENLLLHGALSTTLRSAALQDIPLFMAASNLALDDEVVSYIAEGEGIFGYRGSVVINSFMKFVRSEFRSGLELASLGENLEEVLATQLIPAYKYVEQTLMVGRVSLPDDQRQNIEEDMIKMLDRLCVAYQLAQIRYDLEQPFHKLSFFGVGLGKKSDILFDDFYQSIERSRSVEERMERNARLRKVMRSFFDQYSQQIFDEQWYTMAELLLYNKREQDEVTYGKNSLDVFKNSFLDGKIVMSNADVKEVMSILNAAGFKVDDVKVQVISAASMQENGKPKLGADEMRFLQELIKRQMDDLREMTRINQREQAYAAVVDQ
ncbi:hypothetical protein RB195_008744 [Necator americanus]|uniref:MRH domain-containing protein n=1 Tax=Necator americanus TaxID=51031 RepID=A0ABR1CRW5_NECAM